MTNEEIKQELQFASKKSLELMLLALKKEEYRQIVQEILDNYKEDEKEKTYKLEKR